MEDNTRIVKSLEKFCLFMKGASETTENET